MTVTSVAHDQKRSKKTGGRKPLLPLDKDIKVRITAMTKKVIYYFAKKGIKVIDEYHDGKYGAPGMKRDKKTKLTREQMQKVNDWNKTKRCQLRLLEYFHPGDLFATLTYEVRNRPADMKEAKGHFQKMIAKIRRQYAKRGYELFWIRNIEQGTKGAWHIHLAINEIGDTASILKDAWPYGAIYLSEIRRNDKVYDEDFSKLAAYLTKTSRTSYRKKDGELGKSRVKASGYSTSRNMPLPKPKVKRLVRWKKEAKPEKGFYIAKIHEGINPATGYKYRRYTMVKLDRRI